ncbi:MAG: tRNA (adenosine(37)-N6)-dimethylallyltransferase MiaA [Chitinophagaceae bacterium]
MIGFFYTAEMDEIKKIKTVIIISGPTAVGKTAVAIDVAKYFDTEIISADSRQCFREMNIGVSRPSLEELNKVKHHFIASHSIHDEITAATFEQYALNKTDKLFQLYDTLVMTGGTGLYIKAFCEGLDTIPEVPPEVRTKISRKYELEGLRWLQKEIQIKDPFFYQSGEIKNPQRIMRALEVMEATGNSILHFQKNKKVQRDFVIKKIGLELPKDELSERINSRVDKMMKAGLLDEVKSLLPYKKMNALQTVGYAELFDWLDGKISLEKAVEEIKIHTRQYAKRQMTWFKKDDEIKWFMPSDISGILSHIKEK